MREPELGEIAGADHEDEGSDHGLEGTEPVALQAEDPERRHARDQRSREEGNPEQEVEPERGAEELREIGRHRDRLRLEPEGDRRAAREVLATELREVVPRSEPELRRQGLDQHRCQVRSDDHPDERQSELRAAGDVGGEVPRIDVGDAGDERGAEERPDAPAIAAQHTLPEQLRCAHGESLV